MKNKQKKKIIEEQRNKQVKALEVLKPEEDKKDIKSVEGLFTNEIKN